MFASVTKNNRTRNDDVLKCNIARCLQPKFQIKRQISYGGGTWLHMAALHRSIWWQYMALYGNVIWLHTATSNCSIWRRYMAAYGSTTWLLRAESVRIHRGHSAHYIKVYDNQQSVAPVAVLTESCWYMLMTALKQTKPVEKRVMPAV